MEYQRTQSSAHREFRNAVLNGVEPPITARATLEARGIDTHELEQRLRQQGEFRH